MPKASFVSSLNAQTVTELNTRIRESSYLDSLSIAEWLKDRGVDVSKSSVHRYIQKLRARDGYDEPSGTFDLAIAMRGNTGRKELDSLFRELGRVEHERQELLDRIRDIMKPAHSDDPETVPNIAQPEK